jgi:ABC-type antimicrobial peptide transport system permease subunit
MNKEKGEIILILGMFVITTLSFLLSFFDPKVALLGFQVWYIGSILYLLYDLKDDFIDFIKYIKTLFKKNDGLGN